MLRPSWFLSRSVVIPVMPTEQLDWVEPTHYWDENYNPPIVEVDGMFVSPCVVCTAPIYRVKKIHVFACSLSECQEWWTNNGDAINVYRREVLRLDGS